MQKLYDNAACSPLKQIVFIPNAKHGNLCECGEGAYQESIMAFVQEVRSSPAAMETDERNTQEFIQKLDYVL